MTTTEILQGALDLLRREGWCQGALDRDGKRCLVGAICEVAGITAYTVGHCVTGTAAYQLIADLTGTPYTPRWNDAPERTFADVEAVFTAAMAIAQAQDRAAVHVTTEADDDSRSFPMPRVVETPPRTPGDESIQGVAGNLQAASGAEVIASECHSTTRLTLVSKGHTHAG